MPAALQHFIDPTYGFFCVNCEDVLQDPWENLVTELNLKIHPNYSTNLSGYLQTRNISQYGCTGAFITES